MAGFDVPTRGWVSLHADTNSVVTIPSTINGLPVASIGNNAFNDCTNLMTVAIPDTVTNIGDGAFEATPLSNVTIGSNVISIGASAFDFCTRLATVVLPSSVTSIGALAFCACQSLTNISIPFGVTNIGTGAFV